MFDPVVSHAFENANFTYWLDNLGYIGNQVHAMYSQSKAVTVAYDCSHCEWSLMMRL